MNLKIICQIYFFRCFFQRTCTISYNATHTGWYGVAVQIFDYANILDPEPLSSIPLQFLISVYEGDGSQKCNSRMRFSRLTRQDKACVGVAVNVTYRERFYATTDSTTDYV